MRDLKIRAWSKVEQKMLHVSSLHFVGDSTVKEVGTFELCCDSYLNDKSGMVLMQFTGLHDKNGKEIYEGDVVDIEGEICEVKYNAPRFAAYNSQRYEWNIEYQGVEVIGNIYENGDLLK
jgi:uncharacterized phage protein (TIGR01671 family)